MDFITVRAPAPPASDPHRRVPAGRRFVSHRQIDHDIEEEIEQYGTATTAILKELSKFMDTVKVLLAHNMHAEVDMHIAKTLCAVRRLFRADRCTLFLLDTTTNELYSRIVDHETDDHQDDMEEGMHITNKDTAAIIVAATKGIAGQVLQSGCGVNVPDVYEDPGFNRSVDKQTGYRTKSVLCVPIIGKQNATLGVVQMINKTKLHEHTDTTTTVSFSEQDKALLTVFINQVAIPIEAMERGVAAPTHRTAPRNGAKVQRLAPMTHR